MKHLTALFVFLFFTVSCLIAPLSQAFVPTSDPQYVVMNFAPMIRYDWAADEKEWQTVIKPKVVAELNQLRSALPAGTKDRRLAWSTLQEYMNHPLDDSTPDSYYAIKMRRILEIAEEENFPVFLPLNGFQWWDYLPELYNWWDETGDDTAEAFFNRQDNPFSFRNTFVDGYNSENIWNVEWQDYTTPMNLNWRNWGGGGFRLAPPPNLVKHHRTPLTYRGVQEARLRIMLNELAKKLAEWEKEGKNDLFAGITIGTEVSLNASVTPKDEFEPYGYRGIQDLLCPTNEATCGATKNWSKEELIAARQTIVRQYLNDLTQLSVSLGIPKQRIYTHVWSEAKLGEARHSNYAAGAFNHYSRAGISLYGYAEKPFDLPDWKSAVEENGWQNWGAVEYSADKELNLWRRAMQNVLNSEYTSAKVVTLYNWDEHKNTPAMQALSEILNEEPQQPACVLPEIIPTTPSLIQSPVQLEWKYLAHLPSMSETLPPNTRVLLHAVSDIRLPSTNTPKTYAISPDALSTSKHTDLPEGVYTWYLELQGCDGKKQFSEPRIFTVPRSELPEPVSFWEQWF